MLNRRTHVCCLPRTLPDYMPRRFFKKLSPPAKDFHAKAGSGWLKKLATNTQLFHLNRHSVAGAVFIGLLCALIPIPGQLFIAIWLCYLLKANLPICIACACVTNPFTFAPIFIGTYKLGAFLLDVPAREIEFEASFSWLTNEFMIIWRPLILGSIVTGLFIASSAYALVQLLWRRSVVRQWNRRKRAREKQLSVGHDTGELVSTKDG